MESMNSRRIVEEVVIVEECSDEEGDWVLAEDGFWYCTVEEYEEEVSSNSVGHFQPSTSRPGKKTTITNTKTNGKTHHKYSHSTLPRDFPQGKSVTNRVKSFSKSTDEVSTISPLRKGSPRNRSISSVASLLQTSSEGAYRSVPLSPRGTSSSDSPRTLRTNDSTSPPLSKLTPIKSRENIVGATKVSSSPSLVETAPKPPIPEILASTTNSSTESASPKPMLARLLDTQSKSSPSISRIRVLKRVKSRRSESNDSSPPQSPSDDKKKEARKARALMKFKSKQADAAKQVAAKQRIHASKKRAASLRVFGESLDVLLRQDSLLHLTNDAGVPHIVWLLGEYLRNNALDVSGLFRHAGHHSTILEKVATIDSGVILTDEDLKQLDIHTVAALLKSFLRQLPNPVVLRSPYYEVLIHTSGVTCDKTKKRVYRAMLQALPKEQFSLLKYLMSLFSTVALHKDQNLMPASNLAVIFSPSVFGNLLDSTGDHKKKFESIDSEALMRETACSTKITQDLIENYQWVFEGSHQPARAFTASECYQSSSKEYMSVIRGDRILLFGVRKTEMYVMIEGNLGKLPASLLPSLVEVLMKDVKIKVDSYFSTSSKLNVSGCTLKPAVSIKSSMVNLSLGSNPVLA